MTLKMLCESAEHVAAKIQKVSRQLIDIRSHLKAVGLGRLGDMMRDQSVCLDGAIEELSESVQKSAMGLAAGQHWLTSVYLVVICDNETNAVISAVVWSRPEWKQGGCPPQRTYVANESTGDSVEDARRRLHAELTKPYCRYHWLLAHVAPDQWE